MKRDHAMSEIISVILIILMVLVLAIVVTGLILGANIFQQKSSLVSAEIKSQSLYNKTVISIFHRAGDDVYLNSSRAGQHDLGIYIDNKTSSWRAQSIALNTAVKPGTTVFVYYNASRNAYRATTNAPTLNTGEVQSVVDCPLKIRLVDETAHILISTWNWTCTPVPPIPVVSAISPTSGPVTGGTLVTITGTGCTSGATVSFGGTPGTSVTYLSATQLRVSSPAHAVGVVDVHVMTSGGTSASVAADRFSYLPVVTGISPARGSKDGGTLVNITGAGFTSASTVSFGGTAGTSVTYISGTQISAKSPARVTGGTVDIRVTTATFQSAIVAADQFTYTGVAPNVTSITPTSGVVAGNTLVTITGTGFSNGSTVSFGGTAGTSVTFASATRLTVRSPAGTAGSIVHVTVTTPDPLTSSTSAVDQFTYNAVPTVTGLSPASGSKDGGDLVTISGTGFTTASTVSFGGTAGTSVTYISATQISVRSPARTGGGTVDVRVTTTGGTSATSSADRFTYVGVIPAITSITPTSGRLAGATTVTITGTGFTDASTVSFGGSPSTSVTYLSATQIRVSSPSRTAGVVDLRVTTIYGTSPIVPADQFMYVPIPTVSGILPASGPLAGGTVVTITGTGFTSGATVSFGGTAGTSVIYDSATQMRVTSPARLAGGTVDVTVATTGGISATSSADRFAYTGAPPTITSISPASGPPAGGTLVTITGTGFTDASTVNFDSTAGTSVTYLSATQIRVTSPARAANVVDVRVTTIYGTSPIVPADRFEYVPIPTITSLSPASGPPAGGTVVTITGTGFTPASTVSFGGTSPTVTFDTATQIRVTSPAMAGGGTVDVRVTTNGVTSSIVVADRFTYAGVIPTVSSLSPASGPLAGGTSVTITGTGFNASTVIFGGIPVTGTYLSATQIRVTSPAGGAGTVDIRVTTVAGTSAIVAGDKFTYVTVPTVSGISPASGPPAGGTLVTITGTGFTGGSTVSFGGIAGTSVTYDSPTQIRATAPARVGGGTVDVTVITTGVTSATTVADRFTYISVPPIVSSISPASGTLAGGTLVTITGTGFTDASTVSFGGIPTVVTYLSATQVRVTSPAGGAGVVELTVTTAGGTSASVPGDRFTYVPIPTVSSLSPATGPVTGGTSVIITGTGFTSGSTVSFGGVGGTGMVCNSPTQITVNSPSRASIGMVDVRVTTTGVTSDIVIPGDRFTYT
ncbi:MAG: IPT/TIG domain-containing protein [Methanoregula sp.]|nr:IPT/TIG domain-containing protein [Methanoregula sp.]